MRLRESRTKAALRSLCSQLSFRLDPNLAQLASDTAAPDSRMNARSALASIFSQYVLSKQEHLHHRASSKRVHDASGGRIYFRGRLSYVPAGDSLDFRSQRIGRTLKQLSMKLLHPSGTLRSLGHHLFGRRQGLVQRHHEGVVAQDHVHRLGRVSRPLLLKGACHLRDLIRYGSFGGVHEIHPVQIPPQQREPNKKADVAEHPKAFHHVGLLVNEPSGSAGLLFI